VINLPSINAGTWRISRNKYNNWKYTDIFLSFFLLLSLEGVSTPPVLMGVVLTFLGCFVMAESEGTSCVCKTEKKRSKKLLVYLN